MSEPQDQAPAAEPQASQDMSEAQLIEAAANAVTLEPDDSPAEPEQPAPKDEPPPGGDEANPDAEEKTPAKADGDDDAAEGPAEPIAKSWETIRKHEQSLREQRAEFKKEREALEAERQQFKQLNESVHRMQQDLQSDPMGFLQKHGGITFEDLARRVINNGKVSAEEKFRRGSETQKTELQTLREQVEALRQEREQERQNSLVERYRGDLETEIGKSELLAALPGAGERALAFAREYASQYNEVLTPDKVAERIEAEYREQLTKQLSHAAVRKALGLPVEGGGQSDSPRSNSGQSQEVQQRQAADRQPSTLTNSLASTPPKTPATDDWLRMSEEQIIAEAAKLVQD